MPNKPNHTPSFDLTLLPPAQQQFTILSDTHYMLDGGDAPLEFASRRKQSQRAGAALHLAAQIDSDFTVHLGDLIQEYPDTPDFERALDEARSGSHYTDMHFRNEELRRRLILQSRALPEQLNAIERELAEFVEVRYHRPFFHFTHPVMYMTFR